MYTLLPIEGHRETIDRACEIVRDERVVDYYDTNPLRNYLSESKENVRSILRWANNNEGITQKQINFLEYMWRVYRRIVELNSSFEEGFPDSVASLLEEIADITEPYAKGNRSIQGKRTFVRLRAKQIREGEYFWKSHILTADSLLKDLQKVGVDTGNLDKKVSELMSRLHLNWPSNS